MKITHARVISRKVAHMNSKIEICQRNREKRQARNVKMEKNSPDGLTVARAYGPQQWMNYPMNRTYTYMNDWYAHLYERLIQQMDLQAHVRLKNAMFMNLQNQSWSNNDNNIPWLSPWVGRKSRSIPWVAAPAVRWSGILKSQVRGWLSAVSLVIFSPHCSVQYVELRGYCPV